MSASSESSTKAAEATLAEVWRAAAHRRIVTPSGFVAIIRKIRRLDFYPAGLLHEADDRGGLTPEGVDDYFRRHPEDIPASERQALAAGMVAPAVSAVPGDDTLYAGDVSPQDALCLFEAIMAWSGMGESTDGR